MLKRKKYRERTRPNWTKYTTGIHKIIMSLNGEPQMDIPLEALHTILGTSESWRYRYPQFRKRVLEKSCEFLGEYEGVNYRWYEVRDSDKKLYIRFARI